MCTRFFAKQYPILSLELEIQPLLDLVGLATLQDHLLSFASAHTPQENQALIRIPGHPHRNLVPHPP